MPYSKWVALFFEKDSEPLTPRFPYRRRYLKRELCSSKRTRNSSKQLEREVVQYFGMTSTRCGKSFPAGKPLYRAFEYRVRLSDTFFTSCQQGWRAKSDLGTSRIRSQGDRTNSTCPTRFYAKVTSTLLLSSTSINQAQKPSLSAIIVSLLPFSLSEALHRRLLSWSSIMSYSRGMSSLSTTSVWEDEMGAMADQLFFVTSYR